MPLPPLLLPTPEEYQKFTLCSLYAENRRGRGGRDATGETSGVRPSVPPSLPNPARETDTPLTACKAKQQFVLSESPTLEIGTAFLRGCWRQRRSVVRGLHAGRCSDRECETGSAIVDPLSVWADSLSYMRRSPLSRLCRVSIGLAAEKLLATGCKILML